MKYKLSDIKHRMLQLENSNHEEQKDYFTSLIDRTISEPFPSWIGNTIKKIDDYLFNGCKNITRAVIPDGVTSIGYYTFKDCTSLESVTIPEGVKRICSGVFSYCSNLKSVTIPNSVEWIESNVFYDCYGLESVIIPSNVRYIGSPSAFNRQIILCLKNSYAHTWAQENNIPFALIDGTEEENTLSGSFDEFFWNLDKRTGVLEINGSGTLPDISSIEESWKNYKNGVLKIIYSEGFTDIGTGFSSSYPLLRAVTIPDSVTSIGNYAFENCKGLKNAIIGKGITSIGDYAFNFCENLESIIIPDSVTNLGSHAFRYCKNLKSITMPSNSNIKTIFNATFFHCESLTDLTIPSNVNIINGYALEGCYSLKDIYLYPTTPPTLMGTSIPFTTTIHVPVGSGDVYKSKTNWSAYADKIVEDIVIE